MIVKDPLVIWKMKLTAFIKMKSTFTPKVEGKVSLILRASPLPSLILPIPHLLLQLW